MVACSARQRCRPRDFHGTVNPRRPRMTVDDGERRLDRARESSPPPVAQGSKTRGRLLHSLLLPGRLLALLVGLAVSGWWRVPARFSHAHAAVGELGALGALFACRMFGFKLSSAQITSHARPRQPDCNCGPSRGPHTDPAHLGPSPPSIVLGSYHTQSHTQPRQHRVFCTNGRYHHCLPCHAKGEEPTAALWAGGSVQVFLLYHVAVQAFPLNFPADWSRCSCIIPAD